jgi:hypothetical protein
MRVFKLLPALTDMLGLKVGKERYPAIVQELALTNADTPVTKFWRLTEVTTLRETDVVEHHTFPEDWNFQVDTLEDGTRVVQIILPPAGKSRPYMSNNRGW